MSQPSLEQIVNLAKRRGIVFQSAEIYGGLRSGWDYGPLGVELKENIKRAWWRAMVQMRDDIVGLDSSVILNPRTWEASGHVEVFTDPLVECLNCHHRFRADDLPGKAAVQLQSDPAGESGQGLADKEDSAKKKGPNCPDCGNANFTDPRNFNLMFKTHMGPVEDDTSAAWLRPETAQGIFVDFPQVVASSRKKLPFGIAQQGKSFRNEITPGNFIFRTREFEQMEMEYFVKPGTDEEHHQYWIDERYRWYTDLGMRPENLQLREHTSDELSHYSKRTVDVEFKYPWGWGELEGIANRGNFDLSQHQKFSGQDLTYFDAEAQEHYIPYVIEPAAGATRALLAFLFDAYRTEDAPTASGGTEQRTVMKLHRQLAPIKAAVLPLSRHADLVPAAKKVADSLRPEMMVEYDDAGSIGKRYRRHDEVGTPFAVTVDFDSLNDQAVTVRDRDSMQQDRVSMDKLAAYLTDRLKW